MKPRVVRGKGPKGTMTKNNCRKKALSFLRVDFKNRCAYCMQDVGGNHTNQTHVEHFDAHLPQRLKNAYKNLMLGCSACNLSKGYKFAINPFNKEQRFLNCTVENEFPDHIAELPDGAWVGKTQAGFYHITSIDLNERSYVTKRRWRKQLSEQAKDLHQTALTYTGSMDSETLASILKTSQIIKEQLKTAIPLVTDHGVQELTEEYLTGKK